MTNAKKIVLGTVMLSLAACASVPLGPTVNVEPQAGKPFDQFAQEKEYCKSYAASQVQGEAEHANNIGLLEGVGGTILGAGLGAAIGGGQGAAIGAGSGALAGTVVGGSSSAHDQRGIQRQYDQAYEQCMASKGNSVPRPVVVQPPAQTTVIYQQPAPPPVVYEAPPQPRYYAPVY